jgi:hypothetical protein
LRAGLDPETDHPATTTASATMSATMVMKAAASKSDMSSGQPSHHVIAATRCQPSYDDGGRQRA